MVMLSRWLLSRSVLCLCKLNNNDDGAAVEEQRTYIQLQQQCRRLQATATN